MRKASLLIVAALVALPSSMAAASSPAAMAPAQLFVGGGTFVSNGVFFPGTAVYDGAKLQGVPYQIARGQDIELINVDNGDIANGHQLQSFKRMRNGRPLFQSKVIRAPGESAVVLTSRLKPGVYEAFCPVHSTMYVLIEVKA